MDDDRYDRQIDLFGQTGQEKLARSRIAVVGYNLLSEFITAALASLGIGNIFLVDNKNEKKSILFEGRDLGGLSKFFKKFNREINFYVINSRLTNRHSAALLPPCEIIIDATFNPESKYICAEVGKERNGNVILSHASREKGAVLHAGDIENLEKILRNADKEEDVVSAEIVGGLVADEVRKIILPQQNQTALK